MTGPNQLQSTLAAQSASGSVVMPHHPITCHGELRYERDGSFRCEHVRVGPGDRRTQACVNHSVALLLFEMAGEA